MGLLKVWLERRFFVVKYTSSKEEVPQLVRDFAPQLIIIDVLQDEMVDQLKAYDSAIPILLMTGYIQRFQHKRLPVD